MSNEPSLISVLWRSYCANTDSLLKTIDCFLVYFLAVRFFLINVLIFCWVDALGIGCGGTGCLLCCFWIVSIQCVPCWIYVFYWHVRLNRYLFSKIKSIQISKSLVDMMRNLARQSDFLWCLTKDIHCLIPTLHFKFGIDDLLWILLTSRQHPVSLRSQVNPDNSSDFENEGTNKPISKVKKFFPRIQTRT